MNKINALLLIGLLTMNGCLAGQQPKVQEGQVIPERFSLPGLNEKIDRPAEGSIYSKRSKNLYQDTRARNIGDIVMVKIVETSSGTKTAETTTSRDSSVNGGISSFFGLESWLKGESSTHTPSLTSMRTNLAKSFTGSGETKRDSTVTATLSARVVDVNLDGNLVIRGYREIRVNNETQHIILSGIVRPSDIAKDNSILSTYIADARIEYTALTGGPRGPPESGRGGVKARRPQDHPRRRVRRHRTNQQG